jgi:hypothetical protein
MRPSGLPGRMELVPVMYGAHPNASRSRGWTHQVQGRIRNRGIMVPGQLFLEGRARFTLVRSTPVLPVLF